MNNGKKAQGCMGILFILVCTAAILLYAVRLNGWGFIAGIFGFSVGTLYHLCESYGIFDGTAEVTDGSQK